MTLNLGAPVVNCPQETAPLWHRLMQLKGLCQEPINWAKNSKASGWVLPQSLAMGTAGAMTSGTMRNNWEKLCCQKPFRKGWSLHQSLAWEKNSRSKWRGNLCKTQSWTGLLTWSQTLNLLPPSWFYLRQGQKQLFPLTQVECPAEKVPPRLCCFHPNLQQLMWLR